MSDEAEFEDMPEEPAERVRVMATLQADYATRLLAKPEARWTAMASSSWAREIMPRSRRSVAMPMGEGGRVEGTGIYYSIQGNILASDAVVLNAADAFAAAKGTLSDRVMAAMEAADAAGGDSRCSCDRGPKVNAPCTAKTAHVAYILEAAKMDTNGESYNDGKYSLYISVTDQDIKPDEDANPVKTLRMRYDGVRKR